MGQNFFAPFLRNAITSFLNETIPNLMRILKVTPIDYKIGRYFQSMVEETVNYRERNNITRNDFLQLLIQIKNKVKIDDENEISEMNGSGNLEDKFNEDGVYAQIFLFLLSFSIVFVLHFEPHYTVKRLSHIQSQFSFHVILLEEKIRFWHIYQCFRPSHGRPISIAILHLDLPMTIFLVSSKPNPLKKPM